MAGTLVYSFITCVSKYTECKFILVYNIASKALFQCKHISTQIISEREDEAIILLVQNKYGGSQTTVRLEAQISVVPGAS